MALKTRTFPTTHTIKAKAYKCEVYSPAPPGGKESIVSAGHGETAAAARTKALGKLPKDTEVE